MREIKIGDDWTVPNLDGVGRRTLVKGAVWTVPVVAAAVGAPLAAASTCEPNITWVTSNYGRNPSWVTQTNQGYGIVDSQNGMYADYHVRNSAACAQEGFWAQIDLPYQAIISPPVMQTPAGGAITSTSDYTDGNGRAMRRYFFYSPASLNSGDTTVRLVWQLIDGNSMRQRWGTPATWTVAGSNSTIQGFRASAAGNIGPGASGAGLIPGGQISTGLGGSPYWVFRV